MKPELYIGLMSGTSLDGVDAVLADFSRTAPRSLGHAYGPYPQSLRNELLALNEVGGDEIRRMYDAGQKLGELYAEVVAALLHASAVQATDVSAIGSHGQTIRHRPERGYSVQIQAPALLAERCGITVVADFRSRDLAAGGQGAPLVPAFHARTLGHPTEIRAVVNLGGIANLTVLAPGASVRGFDTGPANLLLDAWAQQHLGTPYDDGGQWAASGALLPTLLARLEQHPYFRLHPPKSCGREEFNLDWVRANLDGDEAPNDVQATLAVLTAQTIADAIAEHGAGAERVLLCGGGARNTELRRLLARRVDCPVESSDVYGIPIDQVEALAFAWLARSALTRTPGSLPEVTGARGARILGAIYPV